MFDEIPRYSDRLDDRFVKHTVHSSRRYIHLESLEDTTSGKLYSLTSIPKLVRRIEELEEAMKALSLEPKGEQ